MFAPVNWLREDDNARRPGRASIWGKTVIEANLARNHLERAINSVLAAKVVLTGAKADAITRLDELRRAKSVLTRAREELDAATRAAQAAA